jgi:malate dehydrogenase (oxaloacetate-decarboxylating)
MAWERKIMRTIRVRNEQKVGTLARLMTAISGLGASVGTMELVNETAQSVVRDITVYAEDTEHMDHVIEAMRANEGTRVLEIRDEVLELHQKGKIAIRSRFPIDSIATLRRVYTPGVAEVCLKIADDPVTGALYTSISHMVAIVTDGTAVLGLGDIGPLAAMPVMEGKAMLMETLVGLSGMPILLNTKDPMRSSRPSRHCPNLRRHPTGGYFRAALFRGRGKTAGPARYPRPARRPARHGGRQHGGIDDRRHRAGTAWTSTRR